MRGGGLIDAEMNALESMRKRPKSTNSSDEDPELSVKSIDLYNYAYEEKKRERGEQTKLTEVKDLYQEHLHDLLIQK